MVLDQSLGDHHEHGCRYALAGNIGDHDREMIVVDHEEIVEVTADFLGRGHCRIDIKVLAFREGREDVWQHVCLYRRSQSKLGGNAFAFLGLGLLGEDHFPSLVRDLAAQY